MSYIQDALNAKRIPITDIYTLNFKLCSFNYFAKEYVQDVQNKAHVCAE